MTQPYTTTPEVDAISRIHFEGNIIPHSWFSHIRTPAGRPDLISITILADVVYWYRRREIRDEQSGATLGYTKKFEADRLQRSYEALAQMYGFTKRQVQEAVYRLVEAGLLTRDLRTVTTKTGLKLVNVLYLAPVPERILEITYPHSPRGGSPQPTPRPADDPPAGERPALAMPALPDAPDAVPPPEEPALAPGTGLTVKRETYPNLTGDVSHPDVTPLPAQRDTSHILPGDVSQQNGTGITASRETNTEITTEISTETSTENTSSSSSTAAAPADDAPAAAAAAAALIDLLAAFEIVEPTRSKIVQAGASWAAAQAWIWAAAKKRLHNAPGLVAGRLLARDPPPARLLHLAQRLAGFDAGERAALRDLAAARHREGMWFQIPVEWQEAGVDEGLLEAVGEVGG